MTGSPNTGFGWVVDGDTDTDDSSDDPSDLTAFPTVDSEAAQSAAALERYTATLTDPTDLDNDPDVNPRHPKARVPTAIQRETWAKQDHAAVLRASGMTYQQIANACGYANHVGAMKAVDAAMRRNVYDAVDEVRRVELARLDHITAQLWPVIEGNNGVNAALRATEQYMRVSERRARLTGMDAPERKAMKAEITHDVRIEVVEHVSEYLNLVDAVVAEEIAKAEMGVIDEVVLAELDGPEEERLAIESPSPSSPSP